MKKFLKNGDKVFQIIPETKDILKLSNSGELGNKDLLYWKHFANSFYCSGFILNKLFSNTNNYKIIEEMGINLQKLFSESYELITYSYLYRHYIELILKLICLIDSFQNNSVNISDLNINGKLNHSLKTYWKKSKEIIINLNIDIPNEQIVLLEKIISDFIFVDEGSYRFRYPHDKKGNYVLSGNKHFSFLPGQSIKTMEMVKRFFDYILANMFSKIN